MLSSSNWEGSDEWIRLNFKWYFYTLLGSMLKEDLCNELRCEADNLINNLQAGETAPAHTNFSSSSSSTTSLANEVVDIDEYIERASIKSTIKPGQADSASELKSSR